MEWFQHAPTEEGLYWVREYRTSTFGEPFFMTTICKVFFYTYHDRKHVALAHIGHDYEYEHDDRNWYYGPIEPPTFDKE